MQSIKLSGKELKDTLHHVILNNRELQNQNKKPVAYCISGHAGLGKTSIVEQLFDEVDLKHMYVLNLSQLDELGDLVGIPVKEYYMIKKGEKGKWIDENLMQSFKEKGYDATNNSRMSYSKPAWIAGKGENGIFVLDDFSRCQPRFMQAVMEIVNKQEYISWKLPKNWTILLTENPDNGTYNVTDIDPATRSRLITLNLKYEPEVWAEWAEKNKIDQRCINFMLLNPEIIKDDTPEINPRSMCKLFDSLITVKDFESSLPLVQILAEGAVGPEVASMFTSFIANKMDKMISPKKILDTTIPFDSIKDEIQELIKSDTNYRADLAFVLTTRLINYMLFTLEDKEINSQLIKRIKDLITSNVIGTDLKFVLSKKIINGSSKFNELLTDSKIVDIILE